MVIFGFGGGVTGVTQGVEQINIMAHNTLRITGHFHATVVGGTTLAFMALTFYASAVDAEGTDRKRPGRSTSPGYSPSAFPWFPQECPLRGSWGFPAGIMMSAFRRRFSGPLQSDCNHHAWPGWNRGDPGICRTDDLLPDRSLDRIFR